MWMILAVACAPGEEAAPACETGEVYCGDQVDERPAWTGCCDEFDCWYEADGWRVYCAPGECDAAAEVVTELLCETAAPRGLE